MRLARWMTVALLTAGLIVGAGLPVQAHHSIEHTRRQPQSAVTHPTKDVKKAVQKYVCGHHPEINTTVDCEKLKDDVEFILGLLGDDPAGDVQRFVEDNVCGHHPEINTTVDCEKLKDDVEFILGLLG